MKSKPISIRIDTDSEKKLRKEAELRKESIAVIIREKIRAGMGTTKMMNGNGATA